MLGTLNIQKRLEVVESAGLPIWITELTVKEPDQNKRAQQYEDLLRLFFSTPTIDGVLFWGFWDGAIYDTDIALMEGDDFTVSFTKPAERISLI